MNNGSRKFLPLIAVFIVAFTTVFFFKNTDQGQRLLEKFSTKKSANGYTTETYHLQDKPSIDLSAVEILNAINQESAALVKSVVPSVISINTQGRQLQQLRDVYGRTFIQNREVTGQGSGVIVTTEGHLLTNHHVVKNQTSITVTTHDGKEHVAKIIGQDPSVDIAVLKILDKGPFQPLKFGDSDLLEVGNIVYAIGSPFGLGESVTDGIISAKKRSFSDSQVDLLQTSAAINPGNSGGPLVNIRGEIVGINSRIYSTDQDNPGFQGIGFAIPSNDAQNTMLNILKGGRPIRGYLGMMLNDVYPSLKTALGFTGDQGVVVQKVMPNSPAMQAGLIENDIITHYNDQPVTNKHRLISLIQQSKVGSTASIKIFRNIIGNKLNLSLPSKVGDFEYYANQSLIAEKNKALTSTEVSTILTSIGIFMREPTELEKANGLSGAIVSKMNDTSILHDQLMINDVIYAINGNLIRNSELFLSDLANSAAVQNTQLMILRDGKSLIIKVPTVK